MFESGICVKETDGLATVLSFKASDAENYLTFSASRFPQWLSFFVPGKRMFESGLCFQVPTTTTTAGVVYSTIEVTLPLAVDDAAAILSNATVQASFATAMEVPVEDVMLEIREVRRLNAHTRQLQTELPAVCTVVMPSLEDAIAKEAEIETVSLDATNQAIASAVASSGFSGALEVTGKTTTRIPTPTTTVTTTTVSTTETSVIPPGPDETSASGLAVASLMMVTASAVQVFG